MMVFRKNGLTEGGVNRLEAEVKALQIYIQVLEEKLREAYNIKPIPGCEFS